MFTIAGNSACFYFIASLAQIINATGEAETIKAIKRTYRR